MGSENVTAHTAPYQSLILGITVWWLWSWIVVENWPAKFHPKVMVYWRIMTVIFALASGLKIYFACTLLLVDDGVLTVAEAEDLFPKSLRPFLDPIWMILMLGQRYWSPLSNFEVELTM